MAGKFVQTHLDQDTHTQLAILAAKENRPIGSLVGEAVKLLITKHSESSKGDNSNTPITQ